MQQVSIQNSLSTRQVESRIEAGECELEEKLSLPGLALFVVETAAALACCGGLHWLVS